MPVPVVKDEVELAETIGELLGFAFELEEIVADVELALEVIRDLVLVEGEEEDDELEVVVGPLVRQEHAELISPERQSGPTPLGKGLPKISKSRQNSVGSGMSAVFVNVLKQLAVLHAVGDRFATPGWICSRPCETDISKLSLSKQQETPD